MTAISNFASANPIAISDATKELLRPVKFADTDRLFLRLDGDTFFMRVHAIEGYYPTIRAVGSWINRIPECKANHHGANCYDVAATDFTVAIIHSLWQGKIKFADAETELMFASLLAQLINGYEQAKYYRAYKAGCNIVKRVTNRYVDNVDYPLKRHQVYGLHNSMSTDGYGLFMEQGTGKTAIGIGVACNWAMKINGGRMKRMIVVCPNNVRLNWKIEMEKFATCPNQVTIIRGTKFKRVEVVLQALVQEKPENEFTCVIIGYDTLRACWNQNWFQHLDWDLGIADESHYFKTNGNKRSKAMLALRDKCRKRLVLTGTPITNTALDLYTQFEFMGKGYSGFNSYKAFKRFFGVYVPGANGFEKLVGLQNLPLMQERLARLAFIVRKDEALPDLPDKVYDVEEVEMGKEQSEIYMAVATQLKIEIEHDMAMQPRELVVNNILTKLLRLAQITSGFVVYPEVRDEDGNVIQERATAHVKPNPKLEKLIEMLKAKSPDEKSIVWACWTEDIKAIEERLRLEGIEFVSFYGATSYDKRNEAVERFNKDRNVKVFIGNAAAAGVGITLLGYDNKKPDEYTTNCDHVIYYSQNWSMVYRSQSEDRCHRVGTRVPIRITDLCVPETIDEEIRARVLDKITTALEISDLRKVIKNVF